MKNSHIETGCDGPDRHPDHLCTLMEQGRSREIAERASKPRFSCRNCSALADRAEDLCRPRAIDQA